jgi:hypothetical protein
MLSPPRAADTPTESASADPPPGSDPVFEAAMTGTPPTPNDDMGEGADDDVVDEKVLEEASNDLDNEAEDESGTDDEQPSDSEA